MTTPPISYFSGGPAKLPNEILPEVSAAILEYAGTGVGILEVSHRSAAYLKLLEKAKDTIRDILAVPPNYCILFMPGGGNGQFAAVPLNLMARAGKADYIITGTWSRNAAKEARKYGTVQEVLPEGTEPNTLPPPAQWRLDPDASYLYYCDNETIQGVEFPFIPEPPAGVPLVCDMSSNICSRTFDVSKFGLIYAGAQKNIGCAGVTLVIIREDLLASPRLPYCPLILDYDLVAKNNSNYNTPPVYAIHVLSATVSWVQLHGGVEEMTRRSATKSKLLYTAIDDSKGFYRNCVEKRCRSRMNVVFTIGEGAARNTELETKFVEEAAKVNLKALKGHRDVGGMRASIFNAITLEDVQRLVSFMEEFKEQHC